MLIIIFILFGACSAMRGEDEEKSETPPATSSANSTAEDTSDILGWSRAEARNACHDKVEDQLRAPGTANFEGLFEADISKTSNSWSVGGYVDAENAYGGEVRTDYTCTVTPTSESHASVEVSLSS
ncbi:hypothetical protein [Corynebacterium doosanense]|uniref:Uncharacterized protein n=1 Tax=Corynebacterium doosanense CAU 212 = DSM 45436 TaxID=558173 RepID=A0A097IJ66_9CORY|nr:hypothetical protein [Corynebacterium doosanense]AIT62165.1 hypothetical protein CDOO_01805 [Corynebacterium doosanense CAU 212 = DSM 45436]